MNGAEVQSVQPGPTAGGTVDERLASLERGIRVWRCLTAVGFLTALGAFSLAVFGLGQLENAYFIGEEAVSAPLHGSLHGASDGSELESVAEVEPSGTDPGVFLERRASRAPRSGDTFNPGRFSVVAFPAAAPTREP